MTIKNLSRSKFALVFGTIIIMSVSVQAELYSRSSNRNNSVPIIYTRGTHYEVGFEVGKTFAEMIREHVDIYWPLQKIFLPAYETPEGKKAYDETLASVEIQYPQYVREIRGISDGSGVPFYKLVLMHLDGIVPDAATNGTGKNISAPTGCTAIVCNWPGQEILGHNEDMLTETLNHWYLVDAHIIEDGFPEEKFCSMSYAGFLPGYTMGYNYHGLVFSINTLSPKTLRSGKTPKYFLTRAMLNANNYTHLEDILRNEGYGSAEGFSVNLSFEGEGERKFHNVEVAPVEEGFNSSRISTLTTGPKEYFYHFNKYQRISVPEGDDFGSIESSIHREIVFKKYQPPKNIKNVIDMISDETDAEWPVYVGSGDDGHTIASGIFDLTKKTWAIYTDKPDCNKPVVVLPMRFKNNL